MTALKPIPPASADDIPEGWADIVREIVRRDGNAVRASGTSPIIEIKSLTTNKWCALGLPGGGTTFVNFDQRNIILRRISE